MKVKLAIALIVLAFIGCSVAVGHRGGPSYGEFEMAECAKRGPDC